MMCAWLLSAATRGRRHLSSLWEESTSWSLGWEGGRCHKRPVQTTYCSDHTEKACCAGPGGGGGSPFNVPTTGRWLSFVFSGRSNMLTSRPCFPFFGTGGTFSLRELPLCFQGRERPQWKWGFGFLFSSLISTAPRENYTLWRAVVIFLLLFSYPPTPHPSCQHWV